MHDCCNSMRPIWSDCIFLRPEAAHEEQLWFLSLLHFCVARRVLCFLYCCGCVSSDRCQMRSGEYLLLTRKGGGRPCLGWRLELTWLTFSICLANSSRLGYVAKREYSSFVSSFICLLTVAEQTVKRSANRKVIFHKRQSPVWRFDTTTSSHAPKKIPTTTGM
jgi:hypothetical protein